MNATPVTVDFTHVAVLRQHASGRLRHVSEGDLRQRDERGKLLTPKQIRARARRKMKRKGGGRKSVVSQQEWEILYKPVEEWDLEELAAGRPRDKNGAFRGPKPSWITREVYERAMEQFTTAIKGEMNKLSPDAIKTIEYLLGNTDEDARGRPIVGATVKFQAAQFLIEHLVGKPTQRVEQDISVKLQAILGDVMVNPTVKVDRDGSAYGALPAAAGDYTLAHYPGQTMPLGTDDFSFTDEEDAPDGD